MAPQKVLLLGSGFVARPTLDILSDAGIEVSVACRTLESAKKLSEGVKLAHPISLDVTDESALNAEVGKHDLVISLIPYTFHAAVIKSAIKEKKHVVTTSYVSPAMMELDQQCKDAGITVMNEIGLDPGIDHLYAVKTIEEVHKAGPKAERSSLSCHTVEDSQPQKTQATRMAVSDTSSAGPPVEAMLLALRNSASYYQGGKVANVAGPDLMAQAKPYHIYPGFAFVAYPNRDSTPYKERYNIPEAETIIRGTLRYAGFPEFVKVLVDMGFLSDEEQSFLKEKITWAEATQKILGASSSSEKDLLWAVSSKATFKSTEEKERLLAGLKWVGIFSSETIIPRGNPLDTLCATLEKKMQFEEGERDLVMLQHKFEIEHKDGKKETRTSTLCEYGAPVGSNGYSAMAKLVGVPCGVGKYPQFYNSSPRPIVILGVSTCIATLSTLNRKQHPVKQVLNGTISETGILAPMNSKINDPLITELKEKYGIFCVEKVIA
ncbi:saccharopine dehydrogenase-2 [Coleophoma crateriformis]|uniref:Saccharopine dehydrogenase-2 n=1 Tax=Coleophoma crateriformis TaxID=565419 RepID=A0A3D8QR07_9HELO|nr:saccharopine dehydrogenase-2 [Coleophoma crateriformis]